MSAPSRLIAFVLTLSAIAVGAAAIGAATGAAPPASHGTVHAGADRPGATMPGMAMSGQSHRTTDGSMAGMAPMAAGADGTRLTAAGLTIAPDSMRVSADRMTPWRFRILDRAGMPVRSFTRDQTKLLHLIIARTDLTGYQHLHPALAGDGTFSVAFRLARPGRYRAIADFTTGGTRYVLGTTLIGPGAATAVALPAPSAAASTDGYVVSRQGARGLTAGREAEMTFVVRRGGRPVTDQEPYLGAYGHLVALHAGDLAYSHVHPIGRDQASGSVTFHVELPKAGSYRLFLQFRTGGRVHNVAFTQDVSR